MNHATAPPTPSAQHHPHHHHPPTELTPELRSAILDFLYTSAREEEEEEAQEYQVDDTNMGTKEREPTQPTLQELCRQAQGTGLALVQRLAPFGFQVLLSGAAYTVGIGLTQLAGLGLRISCNTRVASSCLGFLGVGMASALAGHVTRHVKRQVDSGAGPMGVLRTPIWQDIQAEELLLDAVVGVAVFKVAGGQFRRLMPSDLRKPGAFAYHSVPTGSTAHASSAEKSQLRLVFKRDGCHHCGTKRGSTIGDHIPPTKIFLEQRAAHEAQQQAAKQVVDINVVQQAIAQFRSKFGMGARQSTVRQRYYAQCTGCMTKQATLLRHDKTVPLVMHRALAPPGFLPGVMAAFRNYSCGPSGGLSSAHAQDARDGKQTVKRSRWLPWRKSVVTEPKQPDIWAWAHTYEAEEEVDAARGKQEDQGEGEGPPGPDVFRSLSSFFGNSPRHVVVDGSRTSSRCASPRAPPLQLHAFKPLEVILNNVASVATLAAPEPAAGAQPQQPALPSSSHDASSSGQPKHTSSAAGSMPVVASHSINFSPRPAPAPAPSGRPPVVPASMTVRTGFKGNGSGGLMALRSPTAVTSPSVTSPTAHTQFAGGLLAGA